MLRRDDAAGTLDLPIALIIRRQGTMEAPMHLSSTREAILERIGHTILELSEEVTSEPLPERVVALLDHDRPNPNVMCASVEGLASPGKNGELTIPSP